MRRETPVLMITLQIPLVSDLTAQQVLEAIAQQVTEAIEAAQKEASDGSDAAGALESHASVEAHEPFSDATHVDLLAELGYDHGE